MNSEEKLNNIIVKVENLEKRMNIIESNMNISSSREESDIRISENLMEPKKSRSNDSLELKIGQNWFAKMGIVVIIVGIMFLLSLPYDNLPSFGPALCGYICGILLIFISRYLKKSLPFIEGYAIGSGLVLFFFSTLTLHFFKSDPLIKSNSIFILLLMVVIAINILISVKRKSSYLFSLSLIMGYLTAIISGDSYYLFSINLLVAILSIFYCLKFNWRSTIILGILLTYFTHFTWFINNPFITKNLKLIFIPEINIIFILAYLILFSLANLFYNTNDKEDNTKVFISALNVILGFMLFTAVTFNYRETTFGLYQIIAFAVLMALAILYWLKLNSNYSTFYYAMTAYLALSLAIVNQFSAQNYFIWLCWQSLLVVSTAVWFKSKHIILANFIIYIFLIIGSIVTEGIVKSIGLHYGIVAMFSARILNWKKDNLELKTEFMRNAYLITALLVIPYSLYHILPASYVSISWIAVSAIYYLLSKWLNAFKYRWMALTTLLMSCVYVIIHAVTSEELSSKIYSLLILGAVLVFISFWYARTTKSKETVKS